MPFEADLIKIHEMKTQKKKNKLPITIYGRIC